MLVLLEKYMHGDILGDDFLIRLRILRSTPDTCSCQSTEMFGTFAVLLREGGHRPMAPQSLLASSASVTRKCCSGQALSLRIPQHLFPEQHGMRRLHPQSFRTPMLCCPIGTNMFPLRPRGRIGVFRRREGPPRQPLSGTPSSASGRSAFFPTRCFLMPRGAASGSARPVDPLSLLLGRRSLCHVRLFSPVPVWRRSDVLSQP